MCCATSIILVLNTALVLCGASLIKTPSNKAVIVGQRMEMECRTDNASIIRKWLFLSTGIYSPKAIASIDNRKVSMVQDVFGLGVDVNYDGSVLLYSNSTKTKDSGVYICQGDTGSTEFKYSAQLIVLGNWTPSMEWRQHPSNGDNNEGHLISTETVIQNCNITSTAIVTFDSTNYNSYFSCRTYFTWSSGRLSTNATNVPEFNHTWNTTNLIDLTSTSTDSTTPGSTIFNSDKVLLYTCLVLVIVAIVGLIVCHQTRATRRVHVVNRSTSMSRSDSFARQIARMVRPRAARNTRSTQNSEYCCELENFNRPTVEPKTSPRQRPAPPLPAQCSVPIHGQPIHYEIVAPGNLRQDSSSQQQPAACADVSVRAFSGDVESSASEATDNGAFVDSQKAFDSVENESCAKAEVVQEAVRNASLAALLPSVSSVEETMRSSYLLISDVHAFTPKISINSIYSNQAREPSFGKL